MPTSSPVYSVALPLDVRFEPVLESDPPQWFAMSGTPTARNVIGRFTADQLTEAGVDVGRLQRPDENDDQYRARRVFESLGTASCCWENMDGTGVFDSTRAAEVGLALLADLGIRAPEGYNPPTPEPYTELLTTDTPDAVDPVETPPPFPGAPPFDETVDDEPETMFYGTDPQVWEPLPDPMLLDRLRSPEALSVVTNAIGWIALGGDPAATAGTVEADADQLKLIDQAAQRALAHLVRFVTGDTPGDTGLPPETGETEHVWRDRNGDPLRQGDRAYLYVDDPPTEVTVVGLVDNFPDQVVQVRRPDGTTVLAIAHVDLLVVP